VSTSILEECATSKRGTAHSYENIGTNTQLNDVSAEASSFVLTAIRPLNLTDGQSLLHWNFGFVFTIMSEQTWGNPVLYQVGSGKSGSLICVGNNSAWSCI
jgi:hypothetical protein